MVTGKLCAPPHTSPTTLLDRLDELVATTEGIQLLVPDLARETGRADRAEVEARRFAMIES